MATAAAALALRRRYSFHQEKDRHDDDDDDSSSDAQASARESIYPQRPFRPSVNSNDTTQTSAFLKKSQTGLSEYGKFGSMSLEPNDVKPDAYLTLIDKTCCARCVINPDSSRWLEKWDLLMLVLVIYVSIVTPVEVALLDIDVNVLFVVNRLVDICFTGDMILQCFLMYSVRIRGRSYLEDRPHMIIRRYLTGWFAIDFVSILPFDVLGFVYPSLNNFKVLKVLRLLRILKLARALRVSRLMRRIEVQMEVSYQKVSLVTFVVHVIVVAHWQACAWCLTVKFVDPPTPRWVDSIPAADSPSLVYLASIYFTTYTMTSVGYGDVSPKNALERGVCVIMLLVSGVSWAYLIGEMTNIVGQMGYLEKQFYDMLDEVNYMLWDRGVPFDLKKRLRKFFISTKDVQRYNQHRMLMSQMSVGLQGQVAMTVNSMWLEKVSFIQDALKEEATRNILAEAASGKEVSLREVPPYVLDLSLSLKFRMHGQMEYFGKPHVLYILSTGLVWRGLKIYNQGWVWGEDFVLSDSKMLAPFTSFTMTYVEVLTLDAKDFRRIVNTNKKASPALAQSVRRYVVRLSARRGILMEARKRRGAVPEGMTRRRRLSLTSTSGDLAVLECETPAATPTVSSEVVALREEIAALKEEQARYASLIKLLSNNEAYVAKRLRERAGKGRPPGALCKGLSSA